MLNELKTVLDIHVVNRLVKQVNGISVTENGEILKLDGNPQQVIQNLAEKFISLSNEVVIKTLHPLLQQCPWIKIPNIYKK